LVTLLDGLPLVPGEVFPPEFTWPPVSVPPEEPPVPWTAGLSLVEPQPTLQTLNTQRLVSARVFIRTSIRGVVALTYITSL
jgi:hypothetical protein